MIKLNTKDILPNKPSELLFLAIKDVKALEKDPNYKFNMNKWHAYDERCYTHNGICQICMAGAVMANTLKVDKFRLTDPVNFRNDAIGEKLKAIDYLRVLEPSRAIYKVMPEKRGDDQIYVLLCSVANAVRKYCFDNKVSSDYIIKHAHKHLDLYTEIAGFLKNEGF